MSFNVMTADNDCNSIPSVSMLEFGLRDIIRQFQPRLTFTPSVGLNPTRCGLVNVTTLCATELVEASGAPTLFHLIGLKKLAHKQISTTLHS